LVRLHTLQTLTMLPERSTAAIEDGPAVLRLAANQNGRDFAIGDIHGCMDAIIDTMSAVRFDVRKDRLFVCGDLVDRGEENEEIVALIGEPWFFSVRGNHDQAAINLYHQTQADPLLLRAAPVPPATTLPDDQWLRDLLLHEPDAAHAVVRQLARLPLAIDIEGTHARIGIVHADIPEGFSWQAALRALEGGDPEWERYVLWARPVFGTGADAPIMGVDQIYVGHTPLVQPRCRGNVWYVDGGGVYKATRDKQTQSRAHYAGAWNLIRLDMPDHAMQSTPFEYGLLRIYGARN
jgi:serine/threonine protein phosphatase 1